MLVDVPISVAQLASTEGISAREYVHAAIENYVANNKQSNRSVVNSIIPFLESDDSIAVRVREILKDNNLACAAFETSLLSVSLCLCGKKANG